MKILQISPQIPYPADNGGKISIYGITQSLSLLGHDITLVCYYSGNFDKKKFDELSKICKPVFILHDTSNNILGSIKNLFSDVPYNISKYYSKSLENFVIDFLKENEVDIVHIDHLHLSWVVDIVKSIKNIPVVLREHNLEMQIMKRFYENTRNPILKLYSKIQYRKFLTYEPKQAIKFDKCIMISPEDEKSLKKLNSLIKTTTIPVGVEENILNYPSTKQAPYSLFHLGSLKWEPNLQGLNWFIDDILPNILKFFPQTKLYIFGEGLNRLKVRKQFVHNVIKVGYVKDIWSAIKDKKLLIVPLRVGSGMRVKIIEMLAAGKLIVTTEIGKEGIDVLDGKHLFIANDSNTFQKKILDIFNDQVDESEIVFNAKEYIRENHLWSKIAKKFENEYFKLCKSLIEYNGKNN